MYRPRATGCCDTDARPAPEPPAANRGRDRGGAGVGTRRTDAPRHCGSQAGNPFTTAYSPCPNPYNAPANARAPRSPDEANVYWRAAYEASQNARHHAVTAPWVTAREWEVRGQTFSARADLSQVIAIYGRGVYSVVVWGRIGGEDVALSEYAIFHGTDPPEGYAQYR